MSVAERRRADGHGAGLTRGQVRTVDDAIRVRIAGQRIDIPPQLWSVNTVIGGKVESVVPNLNPNPPSLAESE